MLDWAVYGPNLWNSDDSDGVVETENTDVPHFVSTVAYFLM